MRYNSSSIKLKKSKNKKEVLSSFFKGKKEEEEKREKRDENMKRKMKKGATFAYFSLSESVTSTEYEKTEVTGQSGKIPTITLTNQNKKLYLNVSTTEMAKENQEANYYATNDISCSTNDSCNKTVETDYEIAKIEITGSDEGTVYECTGKIEITPSGTMYEDNKSENLQADDLTLVLKNFSKDTASDTISLASLNVTSDKATRDIKLEITGNNSQTISASLMLSNTTSEQNYLAGKQLSVNIEAKDIKCDVKQAS